MEIQVQSPPAYLELNVLRNVITILMSTMSEIEWQA